MATKTLIIRPSFTVDCSEGAATNPNNIQFEDYYKLVNEEIPDDSATYLNCNTSSTVSEYVTLGYNYVSPGLITGINVYCRAGHASSLESTSITVNILDTNNTVLGQEECISYSISNGPLIFIDCNYILTNSIQTLNNLSEGSLHIKYYATISGSKKMNYNISQTYIIITYEEQEPKPEQPTFHLKRSGQWTEFTGVAYIKDNGSWINYNSNNFLNNTRSNIIILDEQEAK